MKNSKKLTVISCGTAHGKTELAKKCIYEGWTVVTEEMHKELSSRKSVISIDFDPKKP